MKRLVFKLITPEIGYGKWTKRDESMYGIRLVSYGLLSITWRFLLFLNPQSTDQSMAFPCM